MSEIIRKKRKGWYFIMFFSKSEKKRSTVPMILAVGALAFVGAASITNKGKRMMCSVIDKCKSMVKKNDMAE